MDDGLVICSPNEVLHLTVHMDIPWLSELPVIGAVGAASSFNSYALLTR